MGKNVLKSSPLKLVSQYSKHVIDGPMAVWDLNSNLDVFSMQTFLRGLIYVR
jgi:hypothetical protein